MLVLVRPGAASEGKPQARLNFPRPPLSSRVCRQGGRVTLQRSGEGSCQPPRSSPLALRSLPQDWRHTPDPGGHQGGESNIHKQSQGRGSYTPRDPEARGFPVPGESLPGSSGYPAGDCARWLCAPQICFRLGRSFPEVSPGVLWESKRQNRVNKRPVVGGRGSAR